MCFHTCLSTWEEYRRREMSECTPHISLFLSFTNTRIVSWINFLIVAVITMWRNCRQQTKMIGAQWGSSTETLETCQHQPYEKVRLVLTCVDRVVHSWSVLSRKCCSTKLPSSLWLIIASAIEGMWPTANAAPSELVDSGSVDVITFLPLGVDTET